MANSFLNNSPSRGLRNNNPGNLIRTNINWQGKIPLSQNKDKDFEQFEAIKWGIRAFYKDIINDIGKGVNTITKLVSEYAPSFENDTNSYISQVAQSMGISKDAKLTVSKAMLIKLAKAKFRVELGKQYADLITELNYNEAWDALGAEYVSEDKKGSFCSKCGQVLGGIAIGILTFYTFFKV